MSGGRIAPAILFDLDGTLVDSAADLTAAVNDLRRELGLASVPVVQVRDAISAGARAILARGLPELPQAQREAHVEALLEAYRGHIGRHSGLFPGIAQVLAAIEEAGSRWGVVTNKREDLARIMLERLDLSARSGVLIGGDTLARHKPDPLPVTTACEWLGVSPSEAVFVGDDTRDIAAGRSAGTRVVAVRWGFHAADDDPGIWGADAVVDAPGELLQACVLPAGTRH